MKYACIFDFNMRETKLQLKINSFPSLRRTTWGGEGVRVIRLADLTDGL